MQTLYTGEVFGFQQILFSDQPNMELVSNDCECLLISKEYFLCNSTFDYLRRLRKKTLPYPNKADIESSYQKHFESNSQMNESYSEKTTLIPQLIKSDKLFK